MATPRPLKNPPIAEVTVDIRTASEKPVTVGQLAAFHKGIEKGFPKIFEKDLSRNITGKPKVSGETSPGATGVVFSEVDDKRAIQFDIDGFSFNHLASYAGWEGFMAEAMKYWDEYVKIANPGSVKRIAARYINQIQITSPMKMEDYFENPPLAAMPGLEMTSFFHHHSAGIPALGAWTNIVFARQADQGNQFVFLIDTEVFKTFENASLADVRGTLAAFRDVKNQIFFGHLTERCVALFE